MTKRTTYRLGSTVEGDVLHDSKGRVVDDAYVEAAVDDALSQVRGPGRPSLTASGGESPLLRVRLPRDLDDAIRRAADESGVPLADWVRQVLSDGAARSAGR
jgi:hypothetical protein